MSSFLEVISAHPPPRGFVLDASVLINFLCADNSAELLGQFDTHFYVAKRVKKEILKNSRTGAREEGLLDPLIEAGVVSIVSIEEQDEIITTFLDLTGGYGLFGGLDDGESATIAYAYQRGLGVVLDEKKARSVCQEHFDELGCYYTVELFYALHQAPGDLSRQCIENALYHALNIGKMTVREPGHVNWCLEVLSPEQAKNCAALRKYADNPEH